MANLWILVADATEARTYEKLDGTTSLNLTRRLVNPGLSVFGPARELPPYWMERFARELAALLELGAVCDQYDDLILAATEPFRLLLCAQLGPGTLKRLRPPLDENLLLLDPARLESRLADAAGLVGSAAASPSNQPPPNPPPEPPNRQ